MAVSAGGAVLQIAPQLVKSFSKDLVCQMAGPATKGAGKTGQQAGRHFGARFSGGVRGGIGPVRGIVRGGSRPPGRCHQGDRRSKPEQVAPPFPPL
jgi:hypothetical protein